MAIGDESLSLPTPPLPRPAARRAAIDAALQKFDGGDASTESPAREHRSPSWWIKLGRRPAGGLVTAVLVALIGVPAAMIALRDQDIDPGTREPVPSHRAQQERAGSAPVIDAVQAEPATEAGIPGQSEPSSPRPRPEPLPAAPTPGQATAASEFKGLDAPAPMARPTGTVAPAAPPPPPPPPSPTEPAAQVAEKAETQDIVLTGSRVARPNLQKRSENRERTASGASALAATDGNRDFLSRLQSALRRNDKPGVLRLVGLPLRVNFNAGPKIYSDRKSIGRDFDLIFTPRVRRVILNQGADGLFTNYQGAMIGDGEVWFDAKCDNPSCSRKGEILITAINP